LPRARALLFGWVYLACECLGLLASLAFWLASPLAGAERLAAWHYALQGLWASALLGAAARLFSIELRVGGAAQVRPGPVLVFVRHASLVDTLLPAVFLGRRQRMRLRWVMKRELLLDPCLDVVGQRLPNAFVRRGSGEGEREIAALVDLAQGMGPDDGVVIFPEGTRFTRSRQATRLAAVEASGDAERLARARRLRHVLPPRHGGPLGLLDACPEADVLVVAHVGFEGIARLGDALSGALIGRRVEVGCWRVAANAIPREAAGRRRWLDDEWTRVDAWIDERLGSGF
jgi:1-acyl-sn-glycerol-3-phosphate acyltransferase